MSRILEMFLAGLMNAVSFFENFREYRRDDPVVANYKSLKRACLWSVIAIAVVLFAGWAAGSILNVFDAIKGAQPVVASYRDWLSTGFVVAAALTGTYAAWTCFAFFRFAKQHGIE